MSSRPSKPQKTCIPEFTSTVLTRSGWSSCWKVMSPTSRSSRVSSGSRRNRAGDRIRLNAMSAWATAKMSLRRNATAISRSSATLCPADQAAPTSAPTLVPTMWVGSRPRAVGLGSQAIALAVGLALGLAAGYYGRWADAVLMRIADVTLAFPSLLLLIAIAAAVKPSLPVVCVVIGLVGWAGMARLVRGQVLVVRGLDYVQAARALGASDARLVSRHILPNVLAPVIIAATLGVGGAIMAEAALSFLGLGAQPPTPSWGATVAGGRDLLRAAPWVSLFPGLAIGVAVMGLNVLGDGLRDALDVRA